MKIQKIKPKIFPEHGNINVRKRVKFGIDPTGSRLHLGHLVPLKVVKELMGQKKDITIILGTFNETRPMLSRSQVIVGTDGQKMSKSKNNCVFLDDSKEIITNKIHKTSDPIVDNWISLLSNEIEFSEDPRERKENFIKELIELLGVL